MSDERELIAEREKKVQEIRELGANPYANGFTPTHTAAELQAKFAGAEPPPPNEDKAAPPTLISDEHFKVAGRIASHRSFGKAAFAKLLDRTGEVQVWVRKDLIGDAAFELWKKMERGDFIGVVGSPTVTKPKNGPGELTIVAENVVVLTKATRPLPEKWHGLSDVEVRYRQRYVDLVVNPEVREVFRKRSALVAAVRRFLDARGFLEVETPMMHSILGGAAAKPFSTHHNALDLDLFMRIAPELFLKRLVVGSFERVYEIGRNFRNEGLSRQHNPEFTMLEFYQAYATYEDLMALTETLFQELARELAGGEALTYQGQAVNLASPWPRIPLKDAVVTASQQGLLPAGLERPMLDDGAALSKWIESSGVGARNDELAAVLRKSDLHGERVGALFDYAGEKTLPADRPAFVTEYPAETSPLSRRNDRDPSRVDRFELFIVGREHANAFSELNDPADQRARFARQVDAKAQGREETMDYDEDYCRALEYGLPPTAGEGIGIDRLTMLLADQPSIRDVILFPLMRPERE
ncbi:MAG TPA: lysine--tRNA ligase [Polyangia bacterium]|jgi:lysyl-tRNA synthetase class 2|nr:lysine--tRNA ligase [Polyangia bacterium]